MIMGLRVTMGPRVIMGLAVIMGMRVGVIVAMVVLAAHLFSMTRKTRCRTSISATLVRLRTARSYGPASWPASRASSAREEIPNLR